VNAEDGQDATLRRPGGDDFDLPPLTDADFARAMARLAPFEPCPILAVAVSGGADSLALALLADHWARDRGGAVTALTVDHRLRPESAAEAAAVGAMLKSRDIDHEVVVWHGPHPHHNLQAAARTARYRLLVEWCGRRGVLHLLTAHHQDDQAETLILRLGRGSGLAGLAGMAPMAEDGPVRLLRPLLAVPAARLRSTLRSARQDWVEDPSNHNPIFARARVRAERAGLAKAGLSAPRLAETCRHLARARVALEHQVERILVRATTLHPAGFALVDPTHLAAADEEIGLRALAALIATIGAEAYPPRFERLARLAQPLFAGTLAGGRTLGGCRILPYRGRVLIHRELAAVAPPAGLPEDGAELVWDNRFLIRTAPGNAGRPDLHIGALGVESSAGMRAIVPAEPAHHLPKGVWPSLPALWRHDTLLSVPHAGWRRPDSGLGFEVRWRPARSLCGSGFTVV
jgi:tRNA(Ile)-lysidine synthase